MPDTGYTIRFDVWVEDGEDAGTLFAGFTADRALAFANTLETAAIWPSEVVASRFLANGYGPSMQAIGKVVRVVDGVEVAS
jgi:hypothetical protein